MKNANKIDVNIFANAVKAANEEPNMISGIITETWNGIEVLIKRTLSLKEMLTFVDNVVNTCFSESDGAYIPEVRDFAIKKCILEMYANFSLPDNVEESYALIYESDAIDFVLQQINGRQLTEIISSIDEKMKHIAQANIEMVNRQINELYISLENMISKIGKLFSGVNEEDVNNLIGALSDGKFDEKKIVQAFWENSQNKNKGE